MPFWSQSDEAKLKRRLDQGTLPTVIWKEDFPDLTRSSFYGKVWRIRGGQSKALDYQRIRTPVVHINTQPASLRKFHWQPGYEPSTSPWRLGRPIGR